LLRKELEESNRSAKKLVELSDELKRVKNDAERKVKDIETQLDLKMIDMESLKDVLKEEQLKVILRKQNFISIYKHFEQTGN